MEVEIRPLGDRVLIQRDEPDLGNYLIELLPETIENEKRKVTLGTVIAVGPLVENLRVGDYVSFSQYAGKRIRGKVGNEVLDYDIMREDDVLAVIELPSG